MDEAFLADGWWVFLLAVTLLVLHGNRRLGLVEYKYTLLLIGRIHRG